MNNNLGISPHTEETPTPTTWRLYTSNPESWDAMIEACNNATSTIDFEIFIFTPDEIGRRFIDTCEAAAARGVKVRFIWDAAGSFTFFKTGIIGQLKSKGIELVFFKNLFPNIFKFHDYKSWYFRNHRRTLVIDRAIAFTGSTSIESRMKNWRDTMVKIEGPVVNDMQIAFNQMFIRAQTRHVPRLRRLKHNSEFEYVGNNPTPRRHFLYRRVIAAIRTAQKSISITVPYFVPNHKLVRTIYLAARRGVDIRIILPVASDFPIVDIGARTHFDHLLKAGVRIFLYKDRMIHTKSIVIDDAWSTIGTLNLDYISLMYNFEANLVSTNKEFAQELRTHFDHDITHCQELTLALWKRRFFVEKIATFFVKFIRVFL